MQKTKAGSPVKDSLGSFGFAVCEIPWPSDESQDVAAREWPGLHGEDVYLPPSGLKLKAYDLSIELCYKGDVHSAYNALKSLRDYLAGIDGSGPELMIYDPYWGIGRKVYLKSINNPDPHRSNRDEVLTAKVTFRVFDPVTEIIAGTGQNGNIISLGAV